MLKEELFSFLKDIKNNNNRDWFTINRDRYEAVRADFKAFADDLLQQFIIVDNTLANLKVKDCIFRFNRDTRFSSDKTPYKKNFSLFFSKGGRKSDNAGYYVHLEPGNSFFGAGMWMPPADVLGTVRQEIDYNQEEFVEILKDKKFKNYFKGLLQEDKLKMLPKGYSKEHPLIEHLKLKSFIAEVSFKDEDVLKPGFLKQCLVFGKAAKPLVNFLNRALD